MNLKKIYDVTPHRKGDIITGKTVGGIKVTGPIVSLDNSEVRIQGKDKNSFYSVPISNIIENKTHDERQEARHRAHQERIKEQIDVLEEELEDIWNSPEMEDWYSEHPDYTGEEYPEEFEDRIIEIKNKIDKLKEQLD